MKKFWSYVVVIIVFLGIVLAIVTSYTMRKNICENDQTAEDFLIVTFFPLYSTIAIFGGEFVFSKFFFEKDIKYFKHIIIFFGVQFLIGIVLLIPHLGYWVDYFRHYGHIPAMMPEHKLDFLTSSLCILDTQIGSCLIISAIVFFI